MPENKGVPKSLTVLLWVMLVVWMIMVLTEAFAKFSVLKRFERIERRVEKLSEEGCQCPRR